MGPVKVPLTGPAIAIGDVNGDGFPDLVSSEGCVAYGEGDAKFTAQKCFPVANPPPADASGSDSVAVAQLTTTGTTISIPGGAGCPITADVNGDGIPDLLAVASGGE